jgi:hypothetical protein
MSDTTEIEKKSLEAHVELCAERYRFLEQKLQHMDEKIDDQGNMLKDMHDCVRAISEKRNDQIVSWGLGIIATMGGIIAYFITNYIVK